MSEATKPSNPRLFEIAYEGDQECPRDNTLTTHITLLDLFAAFALTGLRIGSGLTPSERARLAYEDARAMLKERAK